jgi:glycerol-3-phosphate acyltransferase PlsY
MNTALINVITALVVLLYGYLWGSIQNGVLIGKIFFKKDPRDFGSHNSGGTNSGRLFGEKIGLLVIFLDMVKGLIAFWSVWAIIRFTPVRTAWSLWDDGVFFNWAVFLGVVAGHCWPLYSKFKGGKAVSSFMGSLGGTSWLGVIYGFISFFPLYKTKKIVSLASVVSGGIVILITWSLVLVFWLTGWKEASGLFMWNFGNGGGLYFCWEQATVLTMEYLLLVFRHRANIQRMREGTEKPINY